MSTEYEKIKFFWEQKHEIEPYSYERKKLSEIEKKELKHLLKTKGKLLDACCGAGRVSLYLAKLGYGVLGFDLSKGMIKRGKLSIKGENQPLSLMIANAIHIPFKNSSFDYVICCDNSLGGIPFFKNRLKVMKEFERVLKPNGKLFLHLSSVWEPKIMINNLYWFFRKKFSTEFGDVWLRSNLPRFRIYFHGFTEKEIKKYFEKTKLKLDIKRSNKFLFTKFNIMTNDFLIFAIK